MAKAFSTGQYDTIIAAVAPAVARGANPIVYMTTVDESVRIAASVIVLDDEIDPGDHAELLTKLQDRTLALTVGEVAELAFILNDELESQRRSPTGGDLGTVTAYEIFIGQLAADLNDLSEAFLDGKSA